MVPCWMEGGTRPMGWNTLRLRPLDYRCLILRHPPSPSLRTASRVPAHQTSSYGGIITPTMVREPLSSTTPLEYYSHRDPRVGTYKVVQRKRRWSMSRCVTKRVWSYRMLISGQILKYRECKRSDIRLLKLIDHKKLTEYYDSTVDRCVPIDCEQSIFLAEIVRGSEKGTIVTVECFKGQNAPEVRNRALCRVAMY